MARGSQSCSSMSEICDYDGNAFENSQMQKAFIRDHFAKSYKKPENEPENMADCIANFLGRDILTHPLVANLKLSHIEKESLEGSLTMDELDKALDGANLNSASGIDGYSTPFIKQFWNYFRQPLLRYTEAVFEKRLLTNSFKTAVIKLIPKKGNAKDIKKWRPISLLSCMYKIISRAVNNRLKSVIYRFTSRAQKGFTRGGRKVRLIDFPIPIRSSDCIGRYNRLMLSSDFCIGRLCRFVLSSDSSIGRSCFLVLSSDFCIWRLCRPVLSKEIALPILYLLII
jgi:hypothetical protein